MSAAGRAALLTSRRHPPAAFAAGVNDGVFLNLLTAACLVLVLCVTLDICADLEPAGSRPTRRSEPC